MAKSHSTAAVEQTINTQETESPVAVIEAPQAKEEGATPGVDLEGLDEQEQEHYDAFVEGFRGLRYQTNRRCEALNGLLDKLLAQGDLGGEWSHHKNMEQALYPLAMVKNPSPRTVELALRTVIAEVRTVLDPAAELADMEAEIRAMVKNLDPKTKAVVGILEELNMLDQYSLDGLEFVQEPQNELADADAINAALAEITDDPDVQVLRKVHELACRIEEAEDNL